MKTNLRFGSLVAFGFCLGVFAWSSCKKDSTSSSSNTAGQDSAINLSSTTTTSQAAYGDVFSQVMQTSESNNLNNSVHGSTGSISGHVEELGVGVQTLGVTVGISPDDTDTYPKTITINYGTGDTSAAGVIRTGELIVTLSGRLIQTGTTVTVTFNQYTVNGFGLAGTYSFTNNSTANGGLAYTTQITGGAITYPSGAVYGYNEADTLVQTAGVGTATFLDDVYSITGNYGASNPQGNTIVGEVTTPLVRNFTCANIVSGVIAFTYDSLIKGTLDYGDGTCDNQATLTFGLKSETVTLP